jgi:hypothetical protein
MPRFITFFSYTGDAAKAMIEHPSDRSAAAKALVESLGGTQEAFYWMYRLRPGPATIRVDWTFVTPTESKHLVETRMVQPSGGTGGPGATLPLNDEAGQAIGSPGTGPGGQVLGLLVTVGLTVLAVASASMPRRGWRASRP